MPTGTIPQVRFRTIDGVRIRYADSGSTQKPTVVLTSPWPESVYAFTSMWATLSEHARLFAVDLPGFGASERREDLLSPRAMGEFLARLIAEADLGRAHIVAPDVGTAAALFAAAAHPGRTAARSLRRDKPAGPRSRGAAPGSGRAAPGRRRSTRSRSFRRRWPGRARLARTPGLSR